jgi:CRP/FNR family transcriptional regulator, cyclic AMP receptor protein
MHWDMVVPALENALATIRTHPNWGDVAGYLGGIMILLSFFKTTMIPLRAMGAISNLCFVAYGYLDAVYPMMMLHAVLFPLNVVRLCQMVKLVRRVRTAADGNKTMDWLRPYMSRRLCHAEEVLFRKGDRADSMFYTVSGRFRLIELGNELQRSVFVGELGMLTPDGRRTQTLQCIEAGELLVISYDRVKMLYYQNPDFGFYFMQLATGRLFENLKAMEQRALASNRRTRDETLGANDDEIAAPC